MYIGQLVSSVSALQELNNCLTVEITRMRSCISGEVAGSPLTQGKDLYELEVLVPFLRAHEKF